MDLFGLFGSREPAGEVAADLVDEPGTAPVAAGRRDRGPDAGSATISETLGVKLLHGWLQNRHQTLMPLTLNLSLMSGDQRGRLARILASILLAGRPADAAAEHAPTLRTWLASLGADPASLAAFDEGLQHPLPLNVIFDTAQAGELTIYTYVCALMATDSRYAVSAMLCEMVQVRFDLPTALVRSAARRYRR